MPYTLRLFYADAPLNSVAEAEACIARDFSQKPRGHLLGRFSSMQASMVARISANSTQPRTDPTTPGRSACRRYSTPRSTASAPTPRCSSKA